MPKVFLGPALSKAFLGAGLSKAVLGDFGKLAGRPMVNPGLQAVLKARTDAAFRPLMADLFRSVLEAAMPNGLGAEFAKLAARPVFTAVIDVPAGRTLSERARFTNLLGQAAKHWPAGTDGQAALADLAQRQAERQAVAHEADQAIVELRDQFEQLVTILQVAQQDQRLEARVNLLPPRSATTSPTPTVPTHFPVS
jgi:hypothetical protein